MIKTLFTFVFAILCFLNCTNTTDDTNNIANQQPIDNTTIDTSIDNSPNEFKILALGDSYTIGQSVCDTCNFPEQLKDSLASNYKNENFSVKIIAKTGWTTTDLKTAIRKQAPTKDYDLVTLLIGVNNQFQNKSFSLYTDEFPQLVKTAIEQAQGDKNKIIVVSIPDYAYTPFGNSDSSISRGIDQYNTFAKDYCEANNIVFVNITDITREGLENPALVATDRLHPSTLAYSKFTERILPFASKLIK